MLVPIQMDTDMAVVKWQKHLGEFYYWNETSLLSFDTLKLMLPLEQELIS